MILTPSEKMERCIAKQTKRADQAEQQLAALVEGLWGLVSHFGSCTLDRNHGEQIRDLLREHGFGEETEKSK